MTKKLIKAYIIPAPFKNLGIAGQVPSRERIEAMRLATTAPKKFDAAMLLNHTDPMLSPSSIVKGLGFGITQMNEWQKFLENEMDTATNELTLRQSILSKCLESKLEPALRRALLQRSLMHWRGRMEKSRVEILTVDDCLESRESNPLQKAEPRGGNYHKRIPKKSGKGYNYIYDADKYNSREDAHLNGEETGNTYLSGKIKKCVGDKGCGPEGFEALVKKYGAKKVAKMLKEDKSLEFKKGKFCLKGQKPKLVIKGKK